MGGSIFKNQNYLRVMVWQSGGGIHTTGHIDRIAPNVVLWFAGDDRSGPFRGCWMIFLAVLGAVTLPETTAEVHVFPSLQVNWKANQSTN